MTTLYIMRHGQAESGAGMADENRRLTSEGHRALEAIATSLKAQRILPSVVVCSPLVRAVQTAEDMLQVLAPQQEPTVCPLLAPGHGPARTLDWLAERHGKSPSLLVVGHLPDLGALTGYALGGPGAPAGFSYLPGGMARIDLEGGNRAGFGVLRWLLLPEQIVALR